MYVHDFRDSMKSNLGGRLVNESVIKCKPPRERQKLSAREQENELSFPESLNPALFHKTMKIRDKGHLLWGDVIRISNL